MNTLLHNLSLHKCHRVVYSIFEVNHSRITNVHNPRIRLIHRIGGFSEFPKDFDKKIYSSVKTRESTLNGPKFVLPQFNRNNPIVVSNNERNYGTIFYQQNLTRTSMRPREFSNYTSIRRFSDNSSNIAYSSHVQLHGVLKTLSESAPVEFSQNALIWLHSTTGLPWWATIVLATWSVRAFLTLPLALHQHYVFAKYHNLTEELNEIAKDLKLRTDYAIHQHKWSEKHAKSVFILSFKKERQKLIERDNCHPMKSVLLVFIQIPMWVILSTSLRNLCYMLPHPTESAFLTYLELTKGGFGWIVDLTCPDNTFVVPLTLGLINLTIIEIQNLMRISEPTRVQKYLINFCRLTSIGMVALASYVPSAMSLYWLTSSTFGIVQNLMLMSPRIRRFARIPPTDVELEEPYKHLYTNLRRRIGLKDNILEKNEKKIVNISKSTIKNR